MIEDIIEQIKQSEKKAKEIILDARKEHSDIIERAYIKSGEISARGKAEISEIISNAEKKAIEDSRHEIDKLFADREIECSSIDAMAKSKKQEAIDIIVKKVLK